MEDAGVIELQKDQEDIDMSRNDMKDKLDTVSVKEGNNEI